MIPCLSCYISCLNELLNRLKQHSVFLLIQVKTSSMETDKNFDALADRFSKNIYGGLKGAIRLSVLRNEIHSAIGSRYASQDNLTPLHVLDIGAGMAQLAIELATDGHSVAINDLSEKMLTQAQQLAIDKGISPNIQWLPGHYQDLANSLNQNFDLLLCHALMEWLAQPNELISGLKRFLKTDGLLSFTCYNKHSLIFRNLLKGNFRFIDKADFRGEEGGLTPLHPQDPFEVKKLLEEQGWRIIKISGIRVFSDYAQTRGGNLNQETVLQYEMRFSELEPYKWLGRYVHFLCELM